MKIKLFLIIAGGFVLFCISGCAKSSPRDCDEFGATIRQKGNDVLEVVDVTGQGPYCYSWSNGAGDFTEIKVEESGRYWVKVIDKRNTCEYVAYYDFISKADAPCGSAVIIGDADGNPYFVVTIGKQCWMASNLNVSAGIPQVADSATWVTTTSPARCNYNNSANTDLGKLYNWYAVKSGKLCPEGWHIPTYADFQELEKFLGNEPAGKMKTTTGWQSPNTAATNSSGFNALPVGYRSFIGSHYIGNGQTAGFWLSTEGPNDMGRFFALTYDSGWFTNLTASPRQGYSCRCIKD